MIKTIDELRTATDEQVLACMEEIGKKKIPTNELKEKCGTDYSYSVLLTELKTRGYTQIWAKTAPKVITVKMSADNARMNLNMTKECKARFEKFLSDKSYNFVHTSAAIMHYLDAVERKEIKVNVEVI